MVQWLRLHTSKPAQPKRQKWGEKNAIYQITICSKKKDWIPRHATLTYKISTWSCIDLWWIHMHGWQVLHMSRCCKKSNDQWQGHGYSSDSGYLFSGNLIALPYKLRFMPHFKNKSPGHQIRRSYGLLPWLVHFSFLGLALCTCTTVTPN